MDYNSEPFSVMTIDGLHYIKSVIVSDNPYELTLLCDTLWEGELFEVPATVVHKGLEYKVTGIDVGESTKLENLRELRIPPTVRHIFPEACVGIKSLRKVNIPDHCRVYSGAFAECGIEELILGEDVILEEGCFDRIRAKQVNIPDTTKWSPCRREDYESDSCFEFLPVSADNMDNFIGIVFGYSIWHFMELLKQVKQHLETLIEKIDSLDFCPITWDDSYLLLHELETAEAEIDKLSEQLYPILSDDSFCNDTQNKDLVKNIKEADNCLIEFSSHFRRIYSVLEEEGPKEWYDEDYEFLSAQLKNAKQHLSKDSTCFQ